MRSEFLLLLAFSNLAIIVNSCPPSSWKKKTTISQEGLVVAQEGESYAF